MRFKNAIVVGGSSGLGRSIALKLAEAGCRVAVVGRRNERLEALATAQPGLIYPIVHDVRNLDDVPRAFAEACQAVGGLDLIVYAAGVMPMVSPTEYNTEKDSEIIDTNFKGAVAWLNLAADRLQNTKRGHIVGIGSVAGDRGRYGQPVYNASKAALTTYLEALRNRLSRLGVTVATFKPGPMATEMTRHLHLSSAMSPDRAASIILAKAHRTGEHYLKPSHRFMFWILRLIPSPIFRRLRV